MGTLAREAACPQKDGHAIGCDVQFGCPRRQAQQSSWTTLWPRFVTPNELIPVTMFEISYTGTILRTPTTLQERGGGGQWLVGVCVLL